jgi:NAD(P)-dependent dehydrogenase (short-subunit alcohol dehydrogenase family)
MSKAALNMLTETEASTAWVKCKVAVNSVDPGYMSADPVWQEMVGRKGEKCPIGWEDGAGRVLWPIAKGEKGEVIWGRFLKHFREVETAPNF